MDWLKLLSGLATAGVLALLLASVADLALNVVGDVPALTVLALVVIVMLALSAYGGGDDVSRERTPYW